MYTCETSERRALAVPLKRLNAAYVSYSLNPDEEESLKTTIYAYVRGSFIPAQIRKLLWGKPEIATEEEDIIMDFMAYLLGMLPSYKHTGKMQNWITHSWKKYFFPSQQKEVIGYTTCVEWLDRVSLADSHSDTVETYWASCKNSLLSKELLTTDPNSPWFQLSEASKQMLFARLEGETNNQAAERLECTPQHVGRLLRAAVQEAKQIDETRNVGGPRWK